MKKASILMIIGAFLLLGLFKFPLWNIMLGAPQYPEPLGLNIYITGLEDMNEFDIKNIDGLNHYIGMKTLPKPQDMWEFSVFPIVIGGMAVSGMFIGLLGFFKKAGYKWFLGWFVIMSILGVLGMYDFNAWMIDYGTNLDPNAIMKLQNADGTPMSYKPPLFGHQKLLNFDAYSYPRLGGYLMGVGMFTVLLGYFVGKRAKTSES
jgi:copper chaperone NosL